MGEAEGRLLSLVGEAESRQSSQMGETEGRLLSPVVKQNNTKSPNG
jgi:hypothetical protein